MALVETDLPVTKAVAGVCDLLGFDPLYVANEGKMLCITPADQADAVLAAIREDEYGRQACIIGEVTDTHPGRVVMRTRVGGAADCRYAGRGAVTAHLLSEIRRTSDSALPRVGSSQLWLHPRRLDSETLRLSLNVAKI